MRIIDMISGAGLGIDYYAHRLRQRPYIYADHIWPHDGNHGNIRDVGGTTLKATAEKLGVRPLRVLDRDPTIGQGINAVRQMFPLVELNTDPLPFDDETPQQARDRMERGINALKMYRREWNDKLQTFNDNPLHDWTSDFADALRYLGRGRQPFPGPNTHAPIKYPARKVLA